MGCPAYPSISSGFTLQGTYLCHEPALKFSITIKNHKGFSMGFWGWVGLIFFVIVGWNLVQWGIRVNDEAKEEEGLKQSQKRYQEALDEMELNRVATILDLNKWWDELRIEYIDALQSGDKFLATAKGRDFYARNRRYGANRTQFQVIADEIRIKNEVAKGSANIVNTLGLEKLDAEGLRDRLEYLTK